MRFILVILAVVLLASCGVPAPAVPETDSAADTATVAANGDPEDFVYDIYVVHGDWTRPTAWRFDSGGGEIPAEERGRVLVDVLTGEPQCRVITKTEPTGEVDEYGDALTREISIMYDMDGNLLHDWAQGVYYRGFGDFVIRQNMEITMRAAELPEDFTTELWNYKTGEAAVPGAAEVMRLTDETVLLGDFIFKPLGTADKNANRLSGFPAPPEYLQAQAQNGRIIASTRQMFAESDEENPERSFLLTADFEPLFSCDAIIHEDIKTENFRYYNYDEYGDAINGLLSPEGEVLFTCEYNEYPDYYDGEIAVIARESTVDGEYAQSFRLVDLSGGAALTEDGYSIFQSERDYLYFSEEERPTEFFLAYRDGSLNIIDRDGRILASRSMPGVEYTTVYGRNLICAVIPNEDTGEQTAMLDGELNDIVPLGRYDALRRGGADNIYGDYVYQDILLGYDYRENTSAGDVDIMDLNGNILVEGVSEVYGVGPGRISVRIGFDAGLIDFKGEWIVKRSIFSAGLYD